MNGKRKTSLTQILLAISGPLAFLFPHPLDWVTGTAAAGQIDRLKSLPAKVDMHTADRLTSGSQQMIGNKD